MKIKFELNESKIEGIKYYGKLNLTSEDDTITIDVTVRQNSETEELFVCYPSKKSSKDNQYYNTVFLSEKLYNKVNKELNKKFD